MKKILLLGIASLTIFSCRSDGDSETSKNSLSGTWHPVEWGIKSGKDDSKIQWDEFDSCEKKTKVQFTSQKVIQTNFNSMANGSCIEEAIPDATYSYDNNTKDLVINYASGAEKFKILILTANEMHVQLDVVWDKDGDGINDKYMKVYKK